MGGGKPGWDGGKLGRSGGKPGGSVAKPSFLEGNMVDICHCHALERMPEREFSNFHV